MLGAASITKSSVPTPNAKLRRSWGRPTRRTNRLPETAPQVGHAHGAAALTLTMVGAAAFATVMLVPELMGVNPMQRTSA